MGNVGVIFPCPLCPWMVFSSSQTCSYPPISNSRATCECTSFSHDSAETSSRRVWMRERCCRLCRFPNKPMNSFDSSRCTMKVHVFSSIKSGGKVKTSRRCAIAIHRRRIVSGNVRATDASACCNSFACCGKDECALAGVNVPNHSSN